MKSCFSLEGSSPGAGRAATARRLRARRAHGFTLIELMNMLALVVLVGVVAMVLVAKYVRHSKTAEALSSVEAIAKGAVAYYERSDLTQPNAAKPAARKAMRHFPPPSTASVPADVGDVQGKRYKSAPVEWNASPWRDIRFALHQAQYYAYSFESEGAGVDAKATAVARGDLDANGVWSSYRLGAVVGDDGQARISPAVEKTNPEE